MIFLDTSAIYALADADDDRHESAERLFEAARKSGRGILTHSYMLVESAALLQRRLGLRTALAFLDKARYFTVRWVTQEIHSEAVAYLAEQGRSKLSLVDAVSFCVMRREGITEVLGFDGHFQDAGFRYYWTGS